MAACATGWLVVAETSAKTQNLIAAIQVARALGQVRALDANLRQASTNSEMFAGTARPAATAEIHKDPTIFRWSNNKASILSVNSEGF